MLDYRRLTLFAVFLVVLVRMAIGWQFFYEGVWKLRTRQTARPWSAEGYLKNAQGPLRTVFRGLLNDPDDLQWLDYDAVIARWDDWQARFAGHYRLDDAQKDRVARLVAGDAKINGRVEVAELPAGFKIGGGLARAVQYDAKGKRLVVDGKWRLTPGEKRKLLSMAPLIDNPRTDDEKSQNAIAEKFREAVDDVHKRARQLSYAQRLTVLLKGDPARASLPRRIGDVELYRQRVDRQEQKAAGAGTGFSRRHLEYDRTKLRGAFADVVGPIKQLDVELKQEARKFLSSEQIAMGLPAAPRGKTGWVNLATIWGLIVLGGLLIIGLFTRCAAFAGAVMVLSFYLVWPPWPGVPEPPGTEHSLIVNKNLIEVIALLVIAAIPSGQWFGVDAAVRNMFCRRDKRPKDAPRRRKRSRKSGSTAESTTPQGTKT